MRVLFYRDARSLNKVRLSPRPFTPSFVSDHHLSSINLQPSQLLGYKSQIHCISTRHGTLPRASGGMGLRRSSQHPLFVVSIQSIQ